MHKQSVTPKSMLSAPLSAIHSSPVRSCKRSLKEYQSLDKYKVRLILQGFLQREGVDYNEIFAILVDSTSISLLLAISNQED